MIKPKTLQNEIQGGYKSTAQKEWFIMRSYAIKHESTHET